MPGRSSCLALAALCLAFGTAGSAQAVQLSGMAGSMAGAKMP